MPSFRTAGRFGSQFERRARATLEGDGYLVMRAAGSLGLFDLIAIGPHTVRCIQVKAGRSNTDGRTIRQYRAIAALLVPAMVRKEVWLYRGGSTPPQIVELPDPAALQAWRSRSRNAHVTAPPVQLAAVPVPRERRTDALPEARGVDRAHAGDSRGTRIRRRVGRDPDPRDARGAVLPALRGGR